MGSEVIIVPSAFLMVAYIFYAIVNGFTRRQQLRVSSEFHGKLLDRVGSMREFGEFLNTDGGQQFLQSTATTTGAGPHARILWGLQSGIVLLFLGIGLFTYAARLRDPWDNEGVSFFATVATSIGLGLLLSSALAYGASRRMGLINGRHRAHTDVKPQM